ncbi:MAG: hypothetical protein EPN76_04350 [Burkholderiaceae bacterium]|nr:MAG: hypothetical protein EPN76_04350 [Burkholderiaceae bacterium]TAM02745.1 MAG: hypothetical protein EPN67_10610 [Pusillimonas sp.]
MKTKSSRTRRFLVALMATVSLLFMQLASAAYGCTDTFAGDAGYAMSGMQTECAGCTHIDAAQPGLCAAQASTASNAPLVRIVKGPLLAVSLWHVSFFPVSASAPTAAPPARTRPDLSRVISPPLSIYDCRFQI